MRLTSFYTDSGVRIAAQRGEEWIDLHATESTIPPTMKEFIELGETGLAKASEAINKGKPIAGPMRLAPLVNNPQKIIGVGLNYADHARESGMEPPPEPVLFNKFPSSICADGDAIMVPRISREVDYEAELVVVIGRGGRHIPRYEAMLHVAGYCCGNDVSARDWQLRKPGGQWLMGKSFDTFAPCGPALVTPEDVPDPSDLSVLLRLNGQVMQRSHTSQLIFPIDYLISYLSRICTLTPGDLIFTGTPPGVGFARKPPVFLKKGDVVEVEVGNLGVLKNPVDAENNDNRYAVPPIA